MSESNETPEQSTPSKFEKYAPPAAMVGLFIIWPAVTLGSSYFGWKTVGAQLEIEKLKQLAK